MVRNNDICSEVHAVDLFVLQALATFSTLILICLGSGCPPSLPISERASSLERQSIISGQCIRDQPLPIVFF